MQHSPSQRAISVCALFAIATSCSPSSEQDPCTCSEGTEAGATACSPLAALDSDDRLLALDSAFASSPSVVVVEGRLELYAAGYTDGDASLFRSTSENGVDWSPPVVVFDQAPGYVRYTPEGYQLWYVTRWNGSGERPHTRIGFATSSDGVTWTDEGIAFEGSLGVDDIGGLGSVESEIHDPVVWFGGGFYHLVFTAYSTFIYEWDLGVGLPTIGYARGKEPSDLTFVDWIRPVVECDPAADDGRFDYRRVAQPVVSGCSACSSASSEVLFTAHGRSCSDGVLTEATAWPEPAHLIRFDGSAVQEEPLAGFVRGGTVIAHGDVAWAFEGDSPEGPFLGVRPSAVSWDGECR